MKCSYCVKEILENSLYCNFCGTKQPDAISHYNYNTPYGVWKVTTEGDCEGRSTKQLGIHEGYIDEIAQFLSAEAHYSLHFEAADIRKEHTGRKPLKKVSVSLAYAAKVPDDPAKRVLFFKRLLKDRPVEVENGQFYGSVNLVFKDSK
jgi:hypothetical protein